MSDNNEKSAEIASRYLAIPLGEAKTNSRPVQKADAFYFWKASRGGGALLVASDLSMLYANSSVSFDAHLEAFLEGRRTDPSLFNQE